MKRSTKCLGTLALAATLIVTLTGCTATAPTAAPKPTHSSTAVATPKPTTAPVAETPTAETVTAGQELTADEASTLRKGYNELITAGKVLYTTTDGKIIVVGTKEPVPAVVAADASAKVAVGAAKSAQASDGNTALGAAIKAASAAAGHQIVQVVWALDANDAGTRNVMQWIVLIPTAGISPQHVSSREAGIALGEAFIAKQANPSVWAVLS